MSESPDRRRWVINLRIRSRGISFFIHGDTTNIRNPSIFLQVILNEKRRNEDTECDFGDDPQGKEYSIEWPFLPEPCRTDDMAIFNSNTRVCLLQWKGKAWRHERIEWNNILQEIRCIVRCRWFRIFFYSVDKCFLLHN